MKLRRLQFAAFLMLSAGCAEMPSQALEPELKTRRDVNPGYMSYGDWVSAGSPSSYSEATSSINLGFYNSNSLLSASSTIGWGYWTTEYHAALRVAVNNSTTGITIATGVDSARSFQWLPMGSGTKELLASTANTQPCGVTGIGSLTAGANLSVWTEGEPFGVWSKDIGKTEPGIVLPACEEPVTYMCNGIAQDEPTDCEAEEGGGGAPGSGGAPPGCQIQWRYRVWEWSETLEDWVLIHTSYFYTSC